MKIETILESKLVVDLGWTLIHSVWQIGAIAIGLYFVLLLSRRASVNFRYCASVAALLLSFMIPAATFVLEANSFPYRTISSTISRAAHSSFTRESSIVNELDEPVPADTQPMDSEGRFPVSWGDIERYSPVLPQIAVAVWILGVALSLSRLAAGVWQIDRYRKCGISAPEPGWKDRFSSLCVELNVARSVSLLKSDLIDVPIAVGFLKPLVIVPASAFLQLNPRELETIIAHELIHIRRYDPLVNAIQNVIEALVFFHPAARWISKQVRLEREFAADTAVLKHFEGSGIVYATALANLEEIRQSATRLPSAATAANGGNLMLRIQKILNVNTKQRSVTSVRRTGIAFLLISAVAAGVIGFITLPPANAQRKTVPKKVAIGFVSIPPTDRSADSPKDAVSTARILIDALRSRNIPAIGFVQGGMIHDGQKPYPVRANIIKMWRDAGFEIGVGGYRHIWFYHTPYDEYVENVEKNIAVVEPLVAEKSSKLRFFSYPFLNTGRSVEDRDRFESWLNERGLTPVRYTMDNQEWMYSYAYDMARNDNDLNTMIEIRVAFVNYMSKMFDHYEAYSHEMFGRDVPQTLVLTPSRLVADSADDLFGTLEKRGYSFVAMGEALEDGAYKTRENFIGNAGISWFERWSLAQSRQLRAEPEVDPAIKRIWEARRPVK